MNDWRSTFYGANDHEADWEQCFVFLEALRRRPMQPAWFCAAAHDEKGDDLRRRWDDPRLETIDDHPVVYPGAGSHATYFERGEYIMRLPFPGERNSAGRSTCSGGSGATPSASPTRATSRRGRASAQRAVRRLRPRRRLAVGPAATSTGRRS